MAARRREREFLVALFLVGVMALNYPLLSIFARDLRPLGVPLIYWYLFGCWLLLVAAAAWLLERRPPPDESD